MLALSGARSDGTWSKKPSFSSYISRNTVLDHTAGLATSAASRRAVMLSPALGECEGCSQYSAGAEIQDTCGRRLFCTSAAKACTSRSPVVPGALAAVEPGAITRPFCASGELLESRLPSALTRKFLK